MDPTTQASIETLPEAGMSGGDRPALPKTPTSRKTTAETIGETPLATLYARIHKAVSPYAVLGVDRDCPGPEVREVYRALALKIHPDKVPKDDFGLRELHTSLFQKVQGAYAVLQEHTKLSGEGVATPKRLEEELHARVLAFKGSLRNARELAVMCKSAEIIKASKRGCVKLASAQKNEKNGKFTKFTKARQNPAEREREREKRAMEALERKKENERPLETSLVKAGRQDCLTAGAISEDGEQNECFQAPEGAPHKKVARRSDPALVTVDERVRRTVLAAQCSGWYTQLLSGGTFGSVSFVQRYERENHAMAQELLNPERNAEVETDLALEAMGADVQQYLISEWDIKHSAAKRSQKVQTLAEEPLLDWENEASRLEKQETYLKTDVKKNKSKPAPFRNTPTSATATPLWDANLDERLVCDAEIKNRWDKKLLSGGTSGSISLSQKKQEDRSGAAKQQHKYTSALCEEADHMMKKSLTSNRTHSHLDQDGIDREAFIGAQARAEKRSDRKLQLMDKDVVDQFLLEDRGQELSTTIEMFLAIKEQ